MFIVTELYGFILLDGSQHSVGLIPLRRVEPAKQKREDLRDSLTISNLLLRPGGAVPTRAHKAMTSDPCSGAFRVT